MDSGPIILQKRVDVEPDDTPQTLEERILKKEHEALPEALKLIAEGRVKVVGNEAIVSGIY